MAINANLQRAAFMSAALRGFHSAVLTLMAFSIAFRKTPVEGPGKKMTVPYYPIVTDASEDWDGTYDFTNGTPDGEGKEITVNKRKYQPLNLTSDERQNYNHDPKQYGFMKGRKLALDVVSDVMSAITNANFGAVAFTGAASTWDSDDALDVKKVCDDAHMPAEGRSLILGTAYETALLKDAEVKAAYSYGDDMPIKEGKVRRLAGFDVMPCAHIPANAENLVGFAAYKSALAVGFAPIAPAGKLAGLVDYSVDEDPESGIVLEHRVWGDPDTDSVREVLECNYGFTVGEAAALKRLVSA